MTMALEGGEGSASRPSRSLPPGKTRYPLYRRLGGPQGQYGQARKISPPPHRDSIPGPSSLQPVAILTSLPSPQLTVRVKVIIVCIFFSEMSDEAIMGLNLPTGIPFVYELDENLKPVVSMQFLGDPETVKKAMEAVAAQGKAK